MMSFTASLIEETPISLSLLTTIRELGEYKGKQDLFARQSPQILESLREVAIIQSTESSNRIEGILAPANVIKDLVSRKAEPQNRPEQEIAGYRDVLDTIHASHDHMPFTPNIVLQLHRDLYAFSPAEGGRWKATDNTITETMPDGSTRVRFQPVAPHRTEGAMQDLHDRFNEAWERGHVDKLLLIPTYVLDFLCIHPFLDGNGRMARLLSLLLLYKAGYEVGRYISLEQVVEDTKEGYYDTLFRSSQNWHEGHHDLRPFWDYFLGVVLLESYRRFEDRVGGITNGRGAKADMIRAAVHHLPGQFRYADVQRACPGVSRPTITRALNKLKDEGAIVLLRAGRDALWEKRG